MSALLLVTLMMVVGSAVTGYVSRVANERSQYVACLETEILP